MKKWVALLLCLLLSLGSFSAVFAEEEKITLTLTFWGNDNYEAMFDEICALYTAEHPNVTVDTVLIPFSEYANKLAIMYASDSPPDVAWLPTEYIVQYLSNGSLLDVTEAVTQDADFAFEDIYPSAAAHLWVDGKLHGVPTNAAPQVIFYNKDLLNAAGLTDPNELGKDWTYEKLREYALAMTDAAKGIWGVALVRDWKSWSDGLVDLIRQYGGDIFNADFSEFTLNSPNTQAALQYFSDLMFVDKVHPMPGDQVTFESGQLAMYQNNYSQVGKLGEVPFDWDIAPMPYGDGDLWVGASAMCVFEQSEHPEEAIELLKMITSVEGQTIASRLIVPSRRSLQESDTFIKANTPPSEKGVRTALIERMSVNGRAFVTPSNWTTISAAIQSGLDELFGQTADVQTCLELIDEEVAFLLE